jgi:hypothetical protein
MVLQPFLGPWLLPTHRTTQHIINAHTNINALSGIRTQDPRVRASEDNLCLRPRGHCDRLIIKLLYSVFNIRTAVIHTPVGNSDVHAQK